MKRLTIAGICAALLVAVAVLSAHEDYRIIGTVTKVTAKALDVKQTKDGKVISMTMDNETIVSRDKKNVNRAELKAGLNVVVDARGDSLKDPPGPRSAARSSADDETVGEATQETQQGL